MCWCLTDGAATDIGAHGRPVDRVHHRGHGFRGRQPVAVVVARCDGATVVEVAEHERHRTEPLHAAARLTEVLAVRAFVAHHKEHGVTIPHLVCAPWTVGHLCRLTVFDNVEPGFSSGRPCNPGQTWRSWVSRETGQAISPNSARSARIARKSELARKTGQPWITLRSLQPSKAIQPW
ncbi:hypothetical protein NP493_773g00004 [Ridgeia piscesae]|uniref:Uncharacterized protein n=1 Tax=Ridgeia piscesae TaxID=27915 RepID=A0AAD9KP18_RIDPI|nr:hypothetical protein NP493_773g00004 [Ridgeia piscesae]